jgi:hypothetical protein
MLVRGGFLAGTLPLRTVDSISHAQAVTWCETNHDSRLRNR